MKTRRKELIKSGRTATDKTLGPVLQLVPNPFSNLTSTDRIQVITEIAQNSEKKFTESLAKIIEILKYYDPVSLLPILATYGLTVGIGEKGVRVRDSDAKIHQSHIEICQGLALQIKPEKLKRQPFGPDVVQDLWNSLTDLTTSYSYRDMTQLSEIDSNKAKEVRLLQQWMKSNTLMVRNWGYFSQVKSIALEMYGVFDEMLEKAYGYNASNVINLFHLLIKKIERANTNRYQILSSLFQLKDKNELVVKYHELIEAPPEKAKQFIHNIEIESIPFKTLFLMLVSHHDLRLHENYEFISSDLSGELGVDELVIKKILDEFSHEWGSLESYETEHLFLSNPVWLRPIIKTENNKYVCIFPQVFFSFVIPSLDRLVSVLDRTILSNRRAAYLEDKIVEVINRKFPESNTVSGVKWSIDDTEFETDLITFIDSHAIIVEAKSGRISDPALRGAPARLKKHIEEILIAPNMQSKRLKKRLEELIANPKLDDSLRHNLPVNLEQIHKIIRVSVSLEDFGSVQANVAQLRETGWLPVDFEPCPTMNLADLETLFDFLDHPVQILHYLERRQELESTLGYMGGELDLMGLYIGTLFSLGKIEPDANFIITEMSHPLDVYYNSKSEGIETPKPAPQISPLFAGIMEQLEKRNTPRWTEIGVILNRISPDDQQRLTKMISALKKNVRKNWMKDNHKNMAICVPLKPCKHAICYVIYNNNNARERDEFVQVAARSALEHDHIEQCLVVAKNMEKDDFCYHFIGLME